MKKSVIALWVAAALFLVCSFTFLPDGIAEFISGVVIAAVLAFLGYRKNKKDKQAAIEAARKLEEQKREQAEAEARRREFEATHGVLTLSVAGVTFDSRQRVLASLYKDSDGIGIDGRLEECEYEGKPAIRIFGEDDLIGFVRASDVSTVLEILDKIEDVTITIDYFHDEGNKIYNATARVVYAK